MTFTVIYINGWNGCKYEKNFKASQHSEATDYMRAAFNQAQCVEAQLYINMDGKRTMIDALCD